MVTLDFTNVLPHGQLDQPTDLKDYYPRGGRKRKRASLISEVDDPTRLLQEYTMCRREHGSFAITLNV